MNGMIDLTGKVILVTGGSRGIGEGIVKVLLGAGADVVLHYNASAKEAEAIAAAAPEGRCLLIHADLSEPRAPLALWDAAVGWKGRIDVLVNNAAVRIEAAIDAPFEEWDRAWEQSMRINLIATAHLSRLAMAHFKACDEGRAEKVGGTIINISSRPAFRGDRPDFLHDGASKAGMVALARGIARWFASDEVISFVVVPGMIESTQISNFIRLYGKSEAVDEIPLGEMGKPEDVANVVAFLASGLARYSTGATIDVGGASYVH